MARKKIAKEVVETKKVVSTAKEELLAYIEDLKRRDVHEYSVRESQLNNQLNQL